MTLRPLIWTLAGFIVWTVAFGVLYATLSVGCAFDWPAGRLRLALILLTIVAVLVAAAPLLRHETPGPFARVARLGAIAAFASTLLTFAPVAGLSLCD